MKPPSPHQRLIISSVIAFILIVGLAGGIYFHINKGSDTVIKAIEQSGRRVYQIIYQETVNNGVVVFYNHDVGSEYALNAGFVEHSWLGWKWVLGGGFSGTTISGQYFPRTAGTPFPLIFGVIKNQDINKIEIRDKKNDNTKTAKMVGKDNNKIWFLFLDNQDGPDFDIISLSEKGQVLDSIGFNITNLDF